MSGTELIMGMEEIIQHMRELEKREENLKEALAQKFYKHYDEMNYDKLSLARTIGPDLGRMVDHLMEENKKLKEKNDDFEAMMIDAEAEDQGRDNTIASLEEENKQLKEEVESLEKTLEQAKETAYHTGVDISTDNQETSEDLLYYRFYTYTLDKSGDCDLTKEDVDEFTEDEAQRKILYDRIGYEEDSYSDEEEEEGVITDLNGTKIKVPSEEECLQKFGVTQGEFIMLAKKSDCSQL